MRRRTRLIPVLLAVVLSWAAPLLPVSPATPVTPASARSNEAFVVKPGVTFNDPTGSRAEERRIVTHVEQAIDNAPKGSTIRIAQYLFDLDSSADKLIAAHRRGVNVHLLVDDNPVSEQSRRVRAVLGTNKRARSYLVRCFNSCMSSSTSVMHAKFFLFSQSGASRNVSMISAANLYTGNTYVSWNNLHTMVGDTTLYASLSKYFDDMLPDRDQPNYYRTTTSGASKVYFYPRTAVPGTADVPLLDVLNHVTCTGVAPGYGSNGKTVVRIAQWGWSAARLDVAGIDSNGNGKRDLYVHHKVLTVTGSGSAAATPGSSTPARPT